MKVGKKIMEKLDKVQKMLTFGEKNKYLNCLITSGAFIISSFSHEIYVLYVTFGVMCGIAQSFSFVGGASILYFYFKDRKGLATGTFFL